MITIINVGYGRLTVDGDPIVIQQHNDALALLYCKSGREVRIAIDDYFRAVMLPVGVRLITIEQE